MEEYDHWQHLSKHVHGPDDLEKSERHVLFGHWVVTELLPRTTDAMRGRVLDVAGGKGHLSAAIAEAGMQCALIDPHAVTGRALHNVAPEDAGEQDLCETRFSNSEPVIVLRQTLQQVVTTLPWLVDNCAGIVGLHPDEATEPIVDIALARGLPFAVLPCCVYPTVFNHRKTLCGGGVRKHGAFIEYLMEKDPRMRCATLPFIGRNTVVFMTADDFQRPRVFLPRPDYNKCHQAAKKGNLLLLQELRRDGHPWNTELCQAAAWAGHKEVLEWALLNGCPWSWSVVVDAARLGDREDVVQWALHSTRDIVGQA